MTLNQSQLRYLKKNLKRYPLRKISADLNLPEEEILKDLKGRWSKEKYNNFLRNEGRRENVASIYQFDLKNLLKTNWIIFLFLTSLVIISYANSLNNDFVSDDLPSILNNKEIGHFGYISSQLYSFVRAILYNIAFIIGGTSPIYYRLINLFFHLGTVWVIYTLLYLLTKRKVALFSAAIFAVHPILIEAVTWISGGPYSQYTFFFLLAFLTYILSEKDKRYYTASIIFFMLSLFTNEKAVVFPIIVTFYEIAFGDVKRNIKKLIPFFVLSGVRALIAFSNLNYRLGVLETKHYRESGVDNPFLLVPVAITSYLELIFFPRDLTLYQTEMTFTQIDFAVRVIVFILLLLAIGYGYKKNRQLFFWLSFFVISLLPTLTPFRISWIVAERYVYLGSLGIFVVVALLLNRIREFNKLKYLSYFLFVLIITALSIKAIYRNIDWKNEDNLWIATAQKSPSSPNAHNNLGDVYFRHNDLENAAKEFSKAIKLRPNYAEAYHNLGNTYNNMGKKQEAILSYQKAISINPGIWQSYLNMAAIYFEQEKYEIAAQNLEKAATIIDPPNSLIYSNLGTTYMKLDNKDKAKETFLKALNIDPNNQRARVGLIEASNTSQE